MDVGRLIGCAVALLPLIISVSAQAEPIIEVGRIELMYGMADQKVPLLVTGGDSVEVLNFMIQVADGGPELGDSGLGLIDGPGIAGPHITAIDLVTGTIFQGNCLGQSNDNWAPQLKGASVIARSGKVPAGDPNGVGPRLVATVTFDTSTWGADSIGQQWGLRVHNILDPNDDTFSTNFGTIPVHSTAGYIVIVPEPSTLALSLLLLGALPVIACRSRRKSRIGRNSRAAMATRVTYYHLIWLLSGSTPGYEVFLKKLAVLRRPMC